MLLVPERENAGRLPGIAIEAKWARGLPGGAEGGSAGAALASLADDALAQAASRSYADALPAGPVLEWGIAFSGKRVAALCRRIG